MPTLELEQRRATASPNSFDVAARTVEAIVATNTPVRRRDAIGDYLEILEPGGADLSALRGVSVLDTHQTDGLRHVIGVVEDGRIEDRGIVARIKFSANPAHAATIEDIRAGVIKFLSVGYSVEKWRDGKDAAGNRTRTATTFSIREVSFVPVPADRNSQTRSKDMTIETTERASTNRVIRDLAKRAGAATTLIDDLIDREATIEAARSAILDDLLARGRVQISTAHHNQNSLDNPEALQRACSDALYVRVDPSHKPAEASRQFVGLTMPEIARELLRRAGVNTTSMSSDTVITRALGMNSTSDFPLILADVVGRTLRASYSAAPSGVRQMARQSSAPDFRKKNRLMLDSSGTILEKTSEGGEFRYGSMTESGESYALGTYGKIFPISRQALVNDDLAAFSDVARRYGMAAASFEAQHLVTLLESNPVMSDGKRLFAVEHGNLATTGVALVATAQEALSDARLSMRRQVGPDGGLISVTPKFLLVPPELETKAQQLLASITANDVEKTNPFSWLTLVVEPRLSSSATAWYVVASPDECDGLEYSYLSGSPGPQVESRAGFEVDGLEVKIRLDFGAGFIDHRSWYQNDGEAE